MNMMAELCKLCIFYVILILLIFVFMLFEVYFVSIMSLITAEDLNTIFDQKLEPLNKKIDEAISSMSFINEKYDNLKSSCGFTLLHTAS